ncbi:MAG: glycosyltransferase family 2 protein [Parcubacteria group bacterium]|jgi:glycosyltransferase involved in cell wall biosynthesis
MKTGLTGLTEIGINNLLLFSPAHNAGVKVQENFYAFEDLAVNLVSRGCDLKLLIIDDNSTDGSQEIYRQLAEQYDFLEVIYNSDNKGNAANILTGYAWALEQAGKGALIGCLDADGEHNPAVFTRLIRAIASGKCDHMIGTIVYPDHATGYHDRHMMRSLASFQSAMLDMENPTYIQSSGLNLGKPVFLKKALEMYPRYEQFAKEQYGEKSIPKWGMHFVIQFLAHFAGAKMDVAYLECLGAPPNRTPKKTELQAEAAFYHQKGLREFTKQLA